MALIDRIKHDGPPEELVWKYDKENITLGGQLIVNESQEALFFKGGKALDLFGPGTHTLSSKNLPIIGKLVNLPFGGETPFTAEVWYINRVTKLDYKWGTQSPFAVDDPKFNVTLTISAFGQYGLKVVDSRKLVTQIVGTMKNYESSSIIQSFRDIIISNVSACVADYVVNKGIPFTSITAKLPELAKNVHEPVREEFEKYGLELTKFTIMSIQIPPDQLQALQKGAFQRLEIEQMGDARYQMKRSLEVMETAASNPGAAGTLMGAGIGFGMGSQMAQGFGQMGQQTIQAGAGQALGQPPTQGQAMVKCSKCQTNFPAGTKFCSNCGGKIEDMKQCPKCSFMLPMDAKFCGSCGTPIGGNKCPSCGKDVLPGVKFCSNCGKPV